MTIQVDLADEDATLALGRRLAEIAQAGDVIALYGGLGAGKTTLARGLVGAVLGAETEVPSPTYTLVQTYPGSDFEIWHFDLYRIEDPAELDEIGWDDAASGLVLTEWPERAGARLPRWRLDLRLEPHNGGRRATLEPLGEHWQTRLDGF